jgi:CO/xanthine dehydrogenase FAD-binding subunit
VFRRSLGEALNRQSRYETTVERAVLSPDLAPQWIAALLALDAGVSFIDEAQEVALADFLRRVEPAHGKVASVRVPPDVSGSVSGEAYLTRADADVLPMAAIAVVVVTEGFVHQARLALSGVWREPARLADSADLLVGGPLIIRRIRRVVEAIEQEVAEPSDHLGSAGCRSAMAGVLSYCALEQCRQGACGL